MYNDEVLIKLESVMKEKGISQTKASAQIGVSTSVLSQYRRRQYDNGNIDAVEEKIKEWFERIEDQDRKASKVKAYKTINHEYIETSISKDVYKRISYCAVEKGMVILHGDAGIGKTKAAARYANDHPMSCIYLQASPTSGSLGNLLRMLAEALHIPAHYNRYILSTNIKRKLIETDKTLIIDEAQHMNLKSLEELRNISDPDDIMKLPGTGIVLIGNTEVYDKMVGRQSASFAQLFSRIKMHKYYSTTSIKKDDIRELFTYFDGKTQDKEIDFLLGIARSKWGIRGAVNVYNNAANNEDVSVKGLYTAARELGIGVLN